MAYQATVLQIMIASPTDVQSERQLAEQIVLEWNYIHSLERKLILMPAMWETRSSPLMGDRAQVIINKQVLQKCDLLVGIFWTRIGTPTGQSVSGSVEEIQEHIGQKKPAMLYFSSAPAHLESVDSDQYQKLKQFKEECQRKGLIETYNSLPDFREKFTRQLALLMNENEYVRKLSPAPIGIKEQSNISVSTASPNLTSRYRLSKEAIELLLEGAQDSNGYIIIHRHASGLFVQAHTKTFGEDDNHRSQALWESAVFELANNGLIVSRDNEQAIYEVTNQGYKVADQLKVS